MGNVLPFHTSTQVVDKLKRAWCGFTNVYPSCTYCKTRFVHHKTVVRHIIGSTVMCQAFMKLEPLQANKLDAYLTKHGVTKSQRRLICSIPTDDNGDDIFTVTESNNYMEWLQLSEARKGPRHSPIIDS